MNQNVARELESIARHYTPDNDIIPKTPRVTNTDHTLYCVCKMLSQEVERLEMESEKLLQRVLILENNCAIMMTALHKEGKHDLSKTIR